MSFIKTKKFKKLLFEKLNSLETFDKISYEFNRIRNIMIKDNPEFNDLSLEKQFLQCFTIWRISINGKRNIIRQISIIKNEDEDENINKYDIEYGFVEPEYVEINGIQRLSL